MNQCDQQADSSASGMHNDNFSHNSHFLRHSAVILRDMDKLVNANTDLSDAKMKKIGQFAGGLAEEFAKKRKPVRQTRFPHARGKLGRLRHMQHSSQVSESAIIDR